MIEPCAQVRDTDARRRLMTTVVWLTTINPDVAASLQAGLEETIDSVVQQRDIQPTRMRCNRGERHCSKAVRPSGVLIFGFEHQNTTSILAPGMMAVLSARVLGRATCRSAVRRHHLVTAML